MTAFIGLGANLGDRLATLRSAVAALCVDDRVTLDFQCDVAPLYETSPVGGAEGQPSFYNSAVRLRTALTAPRLLGILQRIEAALGRTPGVRNAPRVIDLDLLLLGDLSLTSDTLIVPHPRLHLRRFVLDPLAALAPRVVHPVLQTPLGELAKRRRAESSDEKVVEVFGCNWVHQARDMPLKAP